MEYGNMGKELNGLINHKQKLIVIIIIITMAII